MTKVKNKLVRGRDWHAWAWKDASKGIWTHYAEPRKPPNDEFPTDNGKWVKVKFVEAK